MHVVLPLPVLQPAQRATKCAWLAQHLAADLCILILGTGSLPSSECCWIWFSCTRAGGHRGPWTRRKASSREPRPIHAASNVWHDEQLSAWHGCFFQHSTGATCVWCCTGAHDGLYRRCMHKNEKSSRRNDCAHQPLLCVGYCLLSCDPRQWNSGCSIIKMDNNEMDNNHVTVVTCKRDHTLGVDK